MNDDSVRLRAFFHHENRTGWNWEDPTSNWLQAEAEEKLIEVASRVQPHVCAVLCLAAGRNDAEGVFAGGSATFLDTGRAKFLVTAEHVTAELFADGVRALLVAGNGTNPIEITHLRDAVSADRAADIATIRLPDDFDPSPLQRSFLAVQDWPPARAIKGEVAFYLGYPGLHRMVVPGGLRLSLTPFCDFVTSVSERQFYLVDEERERRAANLSQHELEEFGSTGGISGSIVFVNREQRLVPVGVVYEGGEGIDTMFFVTHIDRIAAHGTVM